MENQARWTPQAGGYVYNGQIVSTTPINDANGRTQSLVDISLLTNPQTTTQPAVNPEVSNVGMGTQVNQANSGQDVNSVVTQANSMNALSENTANTNFGTLNTPATQSNIAEQPALTEEQEHWQRYQEYVATNNLQGQINELTALGQLTGANYTNQINNLTAQRVEKIQNQDNAYQLMYDQAMATGDYAKANQIAQERQTYRQSVGYDSAMQQQPQQQQVQPQQQTYQAPQQSTNYLQQIQDFYQAQMDALDRQYETQVQEYQVKKQEINLDYNFSYMSGVNDITNSIMQLTGNLLNFQYDPSQDRALQVAQGYAVGQVKEQMNHTGMYYSSMTQNAITRAIAELVPVYEKMAKEELKENISLLQNTATYLMDLERTQYNMWKSQIELQWEANAEERKEYQAALDRANAWGYVSNADAAILGVAPGTLSPEAIKAAKQLEQDLLKEQRDLQSKMIMAGYNQDLAIQKMYLEAEVDDQLAANKAQRDYQYSVLLNQQEAEIKDMLSANQQYRDFQYDSAARQQQAEINDMLDANKQARDYGYSSALAEQKFGYDQALSAQNYRQNAALKNLQYSYDSKLAAQKASYSNTSSSNKTRAKVTNQDGTESYQYGNILIKDATLGEKFADIMDKEDVSISDLNGIFTDLKNASASDKQVIADYVLNNVVKPSIDENSNGYKKNDQKATESAVKDSESEIQTFDKYLKNAGLTQATREDLVYDAYDRLLTTVDNAGDNFDWSYWNLDDKAGQEREDGKQAIIKSVSNSAVKQRLQSAYPKDDTVEKSTIGQLTDAILPKDLNEYAGRVIMGSNPITGTMQAIDLGSKALKALQK